MDNMDKAGKLQEENRIRIPDDVKASLIKYAEVEKKLQKNPLIKDLITWKALANHILRNEVQKRGYYVGKKGVGK